MTKIRKRKQLSEAELMVKGYVPAGDISDMLIQLAQQERHRPEWMKCRITFSYQLPAGVEETRKVSPVRISLINKSRMEE